MLLNLDQSKILSFGKELTLSQTSNFRMSSKLKEFTDDNFKFDESGRKFSKLVETQWEMEKLLFTSNFSFSHAVFQRLVLQTRKIQDLFGKGLTLYQTSKFRLYQI